MVKINVISLFLSWVNSTVKSLTLAVNSELKIPSYSLCPAADYQLGKQKENVYFKYDTLITKSNIAHANPIQGLQVKISLWMCTVPLCIAFLLEKMVKHGTIMNHFLVSKHFWTMSFGEKRPK